MDTPISDFTEKYSLSDTVRFHMPGHKGMVSGLETDITEIDGADSLYEASGIIAQSEANASAVFGSAATFYSVEGSSQCIRAMLALASKWKKSEGRTLILAARNAHRSFLTAAALLDLEIEWLYPGQERFSLCSCPLTAHKVEEHIASMKVRPVAVYLTSPDYLGTMQDVGGIAGVCHLYGIPLLVDNAHGAYLHFLDSPIHPIDLGADMCCDSAHKTLPAPTGCAYLHVGKTANNKDFYIDHAKRALAMFGSTSPSYLMLASLDRLNTVLANDFGERLSRCLSAVSECRQHLESIGWTILKECEPLKITVDAHAAGIRGEDLAKQMRLGGIECEMADPDYVVLMPSPYNKEEDYDRLITVMRRINDLIREHSSGNRRDLPPAESLTLIKPDRVLSIREAMFAPSKTIPAMESAGRILADTPLICPPAVAPVVCGERIPEEAIGIFARYGIQEVNVVVC